MGYLLPLLGREFFYTTAAVKKYSLRSVFMRASLWLGLYLNRAQHFVRRPRWNHSLRWAPRATGRLATRVATPGRNIPCLGKFVWANAAVWLHSAFIPIKKQFVQRFGGQHRRLLDSPEGFTARQWDQLNTEFYWVKWGMSNASKSWVAMTRHFMDKEVGR